MSDSTAASREYRVRIPSLFEIFFGIWLIAKGFNPSAITIGAAKTAGVVTP